ncbi:MAG: hypothetical protein OEM62_06600, partial [Acidobacteriota bacterium]|nr:hypothetical protein [Acidobacteriota bacterium]
MTLALLAGPLVAVESLELGVATQNATSTTSGQGSYSTALSLTNPASNAGPVLVLSSFSSKSNGNDPKTGSWLLAHGTQESLALTRSLNDGSKDAGIVNAVEIFDGVAVGASLSLEHADNSVTRNVDTYLITMTAVPLTTDGGITLAHDRDDQDPDDDGASFVFSTASTSYVPVEKSPGSELEISIAVADAVAPRAVFVA